MTCEGCPIYNELKAKGREPHPVDVNYENDFHLDGEGNIDVLFVGHARNMFGESVFEGLSGGFLLDYIKRYGIVYYGGTDVYKCRLAFQQEHFSPDSRPGQVCRGSFDGELRKYTPRLVAVLGTKASQPLTGKNISELANVFHLFGERLLIAPPHPSSIKRYNNLFCLADWNVCWERIGEFLEVKSE